jgi:hypothetical protein
LGLTFDEFGMWVRLQDDYWVRQSYDAVIIVTLLLLNIVIVRYDLELRSLYYYLLTISEIEVIKEKLQHFKEDISNPLNYDNYKGAKENFSGLIGIVGEVFNFIIRKIDKKTIENIGIEQFLNRLYEEYFNPS